jgi:DNA polymerase-3 subunit delta
MSYKAVTDMINNGSFKCVLLYGTEDYLIDECVRLAKNKFIEKSYEDMNYAEFEKLDDNFEAFREFAETFPFFSEKKLCVVKEAGFLTSLGSLDKKAEDKLLGIIEGSGDFCITIFLIKGGKPDSRKRTVKRLKDMNSVFEILRLNEGELTKHVAGRLKGAMSK